MGSNGDLSIWEFSGDENYHMLYDHFIGNVNCIHVILFKMDQEKSTQIAQLQYWLNFLRSRIPPIEPLSDKGKSKKPAKVLLVASHADLAKPPCTKNVVGEMLSPAVDSVLSDILDQFGNIFDIHPRVFVMDVNNSGSVDLKAFKQAIGEIKTEIIEVIRLGEVQRASQVRRKD